MSASIDLLIEAVRRDEREKVLSELATSAQKRLGTRILSAPEVIEVFFKSVLPGKDCKISASKLYRLADEGKIPSLKLDGRTFFDETALLDWFETESFANCTPEVLEKYGREKPVMMPIPEKLPKSLLQQLETKRPIFPDAS